MQAATWDEAFAVIADRLKGVAGERIGAIAGDLCDAESMVALKDLMSALGSPNIDCRQDGAALDATRREFYLFNTTIAGIEEADALLIIGANPRREAPVLNARIRKRWMAGGFPVGLIGQDVDLTYGFEHLGTGPEAFQLLADGKADGKAAGKADGKHDFAELLKTAKKPMIIVGQGALARPDGAAILAAAWQLAVQFEMLNADWHGFNILHHAASKVAALDLGFIPGQGGRDVAAMLGGGVDVLWLLGADEFDTAKIGANTFVIYQGHHGDAGASRADVILPGAAYTEKHGTYTNLEGRVQQGFMAVSPPGEAREDWRILRAISAYIGHALPYDNLDELRARLAQVNPVFASIEAVRRLAGTDISGPAGAGEFSDAAFVPAIQNYYQTDPISRASPTMAACVAAHYGAAGRAEAAE